MVPSDRLPPKIAKAWTRVSDPEVLETKILERNQTHFGQGDGPFTKESLGTIPFNATGPLADSILAGTVQHENKTTQLLLDALLKPAGIRHLLES